MVTAIRCDTCGTTIPHTEPGLTEHVGHRVTITTRPTISDAAPLAPKDSTLTFSALDLDRPPIVLTEEYRPRGDGPTIKELIGESPLARSMLEAVGLRVAEVGRMVLGRSLDAFPPDPGGWFSGGKAAHGDPLMESVDNLAFADGPEITSGRIVYSAVEEQDLLTDAYEQRESRRQARRVGLGPVRPARWDRL